MTVFACAGCDATLTVPVSRVALPIHTGQQYGSGLLSVLMEPGTYAVNPDHFGPPWQPWAEVGADEAEPAVGTRQCTRCRGGREELP
jgi:hypothetical protein